MEAPKALRELLAALEEQNPPPPPPPAAQDGLPAPAEAAAAAAGAGADGAGQQAGGHPLLAFLFSWEEILEVMGECPVRPFFFCYTFSRRPLAL